MAENIPIKWLQDESGNRFFPITHLHAVRDENDRDLVQILSNLGSVQPDWDQNNSSAQDYVKNRTHWAEDTVTHTGNVLTLKNSNGSTTANGVTRFWFSGSENTFTDVYGSWTEYTTQKYNFIINSITYSAEIDMGESGPYSYNVQDSSNKIAGIYNGTVSSSELTPSMYRIEGGYYYDGSDNGVWQIDLYLPATEFQSITSFTVNTISENVHKLDDKYINTPNWDASYNDPGYIAQRTHYRYLDETWKSIPTTGVNTSVSTANGVIRINYYGTAISFFGDDQKPDGSYKSFKIEVNGNGYGPFEPTQNYWYDFTSGDSTIQSIYSGSQGTLESGMYYISRYYENEDMMFGLTCYFLVSDIGSTLTSFYVIWPDWNYQTLNPKYLPDVNSMIPTLTSPVRIWDLEPGIYLLPDNCTVYYSGGSGTQTITINSSLLSIWSTGGTGVNFYKKWDCWPSPGAGSGLPAYHWVGYTNYSSGQYKLNSYNTRTSSNSSNYDYGITQQTGMTNLNSAAYSLLANGVTRGSISPSCTGAPLSITLSGDTFCVLEVHNSLSVSGIQDSNSDAIRQDLYLPTLNKHFYRIVKYYNSTVTPNTSIAGADANGWIEINEISPDYKEWVESDDASSIFSGTYTVPLLDNSIYYTTITDNVIDIDPNKKYTINLRLNNTDYKYTNLTPETVDTSDGYTASRLVIYSGATQIFQIYANKISDSNPYTVIQFSQSAYGLSGASVSCTISVPEYILDENLYTYANITGVTVDTSLSGYVSFSNSNRSSGIETGTIYKVTIDNQSNTSEAKIIEIQGMPFLTLGNASILNSMAGTSFPDTGEPYFLMDSSPSGGAGFSLTLPDTVNYSSASNATVVSIYPYGMWKYHKIDNSYLDLGTMKIKVNGTLAGSFKIPGVSKWMNISTVESMDYTAYNYTAPAYSGGSISVTFPYQQRCICYYGTTADTTFNLSINNSSDNYIYVWNAGSSAIDVSLGSAFYRATPTSSGGMTSIRTTGDWPAEIPSGKYIIIRVVCTSATAAFVTKSDILSAS